MHDPARVRVRQRVGDLGEEAVGVRGRKRALARHPLLERLALHEGHRVVEQRPVGAGAQDRDDVRMLEVRRDRDLTLEARGVHIARELGREDLHDDLAVEGEIRREEQPAHPAAGKLSLHAIPVAEQRLNSVPEFGALGGRHRNRSE